MLPGIPVDLRQPWWSAVLLGVSLVIAVGMVAGVVLSIEGDGTFRVIFIAATIGICVVNTARALSRVTTAADGSLVVRNWFRTRTVRMEEVDRVMTGRQGGPGSLHRVELLLTDGSTLHLVATETLALPGSKARLQEQAEQLRAWAGDAPRASR